MFRFLRNVGLGALIAYFFDPDNGGRRRAMARDRLAAKARRSSERVGSTAQSAASQAQAAKSKVAHREEEAKTQPDDVTLARKVETEIFRDADLPKGQINVNAENGKVVLRGEVEKPELIKDLEKRTKKVQGVLEVENLLHVQGTASPSS
jgi:osmotically-inducible protein OsmY